MQSVMLSASCNKHCGKKVKGLATACAQEESDLEGAPGRFVAENDT